MTNPHRLPLNTETPSKVPYVLACAYFGGLDHEHLAGVISLEFGSPGVLMIRTNGVPYIDQARAILAAGAMQHLPDDGVLMMLDHDIIFDPADVPRLVERCAVGDYDILGAPYSMRKEAGGIIGFPTMPPKGEELELPCYGIGKQVDAFGLGMGFTAIRMRVFRELAKTLPKVQCGTRAVTWPFFALEVQENAITVDGESVAIYHGEDVSFCRRAIKAGFRVGLDTTFRIAHKGTKLYVLEDTAFAVPFAHNFTLRLVCPEKPEDFNFTAKAAPLRTS